MLGVCQSSYSVADDSDDKSSPHTSNSSAYPSRSPRISPSNEVIHSKTNGRTIGYAIHRPRLVPHNTTPAKPTNTTTAILWFYPLGGCSISVDHAAPSFRQHQYRASVISVDRPGVGATDALLLRVPEPAAEDGDSSRRNGEFPINRIRGHADDVMEVLDHEGITEVYILAICLGHPYALEVARRLLSSDAGSGNNTLHETKSNSIRMKGMALVAPFVSSACPQSWRVARLGNRVPSMVLSLATEIMARAEKTVLPLVLSENALKKLVSPEERDYYGWHESDFPDMVDSIAELTQLTAPSKSIEAQLGANALWQQVCDDFAVESGFGLKVGDDNETNRKEDTSTRKEPNTVTPKFSFEIHACRKDKIAPQAAVEWLAKRCFGNTNITWHAEAHSHEIMTFLGGPMRSPYLMHEIAKGWNLLEGGTKEEK